MDEFFLPEELVEWIGLKKSELLSELILARPEGDLPIESFHEYDQFIPTTLSKPDWSEEILEDGQRIKFFCCHHQATDAFYQLVIGVLIEDQHGQDVYVPILTLVTKFEEHALHFLLKQKKQRLLN